MSMHNFEGKEDGRAEEGCLINGDKALSAHDCFRYGQSDCTLIVRRLLVKSGLSRLLSWL